MNSLIIFSAKYLIFIIAALAGIYWLTIPKQAKIKVVTVGAITGIIALALAKLGSLLINDPRPFVSDHVTPLFKYVADNGFPSDHTLLGATIAIAVMSVSKKWGLVLLALAIVVGSSRVLAHVHHPLDIIGSLVFAAIGGAVAYFVAPKLLGRLPFYTSDSSKTSE